jgi:hypothetical protein
LLFYLKLIVSIMIMFRAYFWPSSTAFSTRRFRRPSNVKSNETLPGENLGKLYRGDFVSFIFINGQRVLVNMFLQSKLLDLVRIVSKERSVNSHFELDLAKKSFHFNIHYSWFLSS